LDVQKGDVILDIGCGGKCDLALSLFVVFGDFPLCLSPIIFRWQYFSIWRQRWFLSPWLIKSRIGHVKAFDGEQVSFSPGPYDPAL
jgi:hypothetical protein